MESWEDCLMPDQTGHAVLAGLNGRILLRRLGQEGHFRRKLEQDARIVDTAHRTMCN
jgi:hypothetical protein